MNKNFLSARYSIKLLLLAAFTFLSGYAVKGQSFIKSMGAGVKFPVKCTCTDSQGNVFVAYGIHQDTTYISTWDAGAKTWTALPPLPNFYSEFTKVSTCNVLSGNFYITGRNSLTNKVDLMRYNGGWAKVTSFNMPYAFLSLNSIVFKQKIYFAGAFDSVGNSYMPGVAAFDGTSFSSAGFPTSYFTSGGPFESSLAATADSLFITAKNKILLHKAPGTWSTFKTFAPWVSNLTTVGKLLYTYDYTGIIRGYKYGKLIDSFAIMNTASSLMGLNDGRVLFRSQSTFYSIKNGLVNPVFRLQSRDTNNLSFLAFGNQLYYFGSDGVVINKIDYNNIIEIDQDSLFEVGFDTVVIKAFIDKNKNTVYDGGDVNLQYIDFYLGQGSYVTTDANGYAYRVVLENEDIDISYRSGISSDSCFKLPFSGNLSTKCYNSPLTRDTLYYPFRRTSLMNRNLILRSYSSSRARLMDSLNLYFNVYNKDCDFNTSSATVKIKLDSNTNFVSSNPNYTSRNGNELTYNLTNIYPYDMARYIIVKVMYPNTKYTIGQYVRHSARLTTTFAEDTMDNVDSVVQKMAYSYDPNAKHSVPEGRITKDLKNVRYYIEFQNEGNDDAVRVTVVDTLNLSIPVYEFQMVGASHPYTVSVKPGTNIVTWIFNNINLKPKSQNIGLSKGYIIFDAKLKANVKVGDSIRNRASIYFDYNTPVITNYAVISRVDPKANIDQLWVSENKTLKVYPNPAGNYFHIENALSSPQHLTVYDLKGVKIMNVNMNQKEVRTISTESWSKGLYVIVNEKGEGLKIMIE